MTLLSSVASPPLDSPVHGATTWVRRGWPDLLSGGPALLAGVLALIVPHVGLGGPDVAAATYRVGEVRTYGLVLWDSGWYGGNSPPGYSVGFPVLGALIGLIALGVAGAVAATWAFDRLTLAAWGRRSAARWYFAVSTILPVAIGQLPFLCGEAFGLLSLLALFHRRTPAALILSVCSALCSPLAAAFLAVACVAWAVDSSDRRPAAVLSAGTVAIVVLYVAIAFPGTGSFPFPWQALVLTLLLCAAVAAPGVGAAPVLRWGALLYALSALGSFVVPNPLGGNAPRLAGAIGVPLLICLLTLRPRHASRLGRVAVATLAVGLVLWQWAPGLRTVNSPSVRAAGRVAFYRPVLDQILTRSHGPVRIEAVPTSHHWESAYLAPRLSLARGWERQLDIGDNPLFYDTGALTARSYLAWLHRNAVTWVALPHTALDYAALREAALLDRRNIPGLALVWSSPDWRLWRVTEGPGLLSGPGRLDALAPDRVSLQVERPGIVTVRIRYSSYWDLPSGDGACLVPAPGGWTDVVASRRGTFHLSMSVFGGHSANCAHR